MKIVSWNDDGIVFSDGSSITHNHDQDCCETNYPDYSVLDVFYNDEEFDDYFITPVDEAGFNLVLTSKGFFDLDLTVSKRIFIPCYSYQNGYYSTNLEIHVTNKPIYKICLDCDGRFDD